jgi:GTP-binding protein HflX
MASFTTTVDRPRAVIFAVQPGGQAADERRNESLAELKELLEAAEVDCVGEVVQLRERPNPKTYLGPGKLLELRDAVKRLGATVVVCEDNLTPAQVASVLDAVDADVLDRTELILSVFAKHAHSLEGTMQVHLAQLEYELTRVRGKGLVLSRLGAGVDMRGPGETKLEVERRVIRERIRVLRRRIEHMASTRRTQRTRRLRSDVPLIALAGYTNAGKSTLLNVLTDAEVSVRDRLFETLDPTTRSLRFRDRDYVLTDTVGFIRKLPHELVDAFASTLEETSVSDLILVVADAGLSVEEIGSRHRTVGEVLDMIGSGKVPRLTVFNKVDLVSSGEVRRLQGIYPGSVAVSALTGAGLEELLGRVAEHFASTLVPVRLLIPYDEGGIVHRLRGVASDITQESTPEGVLITARVPAAEAGRYAAYRVREPGAPPATADGSD